MAKKKLQSGLELSGIAPNILLKHVENTNPFLFQGEIQTDGPKRAYLAKLVFYKKNLNLLKNIDLAEYFYLCLSAHWATAGTFVPTDVDNQIREGLWKHGLIEKYIEKMARYTIDSWTWELLEKKHWCAVPAPGWVTPVRKPWCARVSMCWWWREPKRLCWLQLSACACLAAVRCRAWPRM
jgi:hypothetical protein